MPARIVIVHNDLDFLSALESGLWHTGHYPAAFNDPIAAFDVLQTSEHIDVLVTQIVFGPGKPHGLALTGAARSIRPSLKVIFTALPEVANHALNEGRVLIMPVDPGDVVRAVEDLLGSHPVHAPP
jgi:DNA-binding NtrC family response regulator